MVDIFHVLYLQTQLAVEEVLDSIQDTGFENKCIRLSKQSVIREIYIISEVAKTLMSCPPRRRTATFDTERSNCTSRRRIVFDHKSSSLKISSDNRIFIIPNSNQRQHISSVSVRAWWQAHLRTHSRGCSACELPLEQSVHEWVTNNDFKAVKFLVPHFIHPSCLKLFSLYQIFSVSTNLVSEYEYFPRMSVASKHGFRQMK